jgi:hypothetical protein
MEELAAQVAQDAAKEAAAQQAQQPQQPAGPDLNITDLAALRSIVDVASQRGAFKAAELESVGKVYNKLNTFLESVTKQKEQ